MGTSLRHLVRARKRHAVGGGNPTNPHAYFDQCVASDYTWRQWSLRSAASIASVYWGIVDPQTGQRLSGQTTYNYPNDTFFDKQDAAKIIIPAGKDQYEQLRCPITIGADFLGVSQVKALITWDHYYDTTWKTGEVGEKSFQLERHDRNIWLEPGIRPWALDNFPNGPGIGWAYMRVYPGSFVAPATKGGSGAIVDGYNYGSDALNPFTNTFRVYANTWTRYWVEWTSIADSQFVYVSFWMADENQDPTLIYSNLGIQMLSDSNGVNGILNRFWVEHNTSMTRPAVDAIGYVRNIWVGRDVPDPTAASGGYPGMLRPGR